MTLFKLLCDVNGIRAFPVFSLCKMQFAFATMLVGSFTQLEFLVSLVNGVFSLTVHQRVSRQFYSIMATNSHLSLLLIQSIFKETYENAKTVLNVLKYDKCYWEVIGDFKMIAFFEENAGGFTKYPCYVLFLSLG